MYGAALAAAASPEAAEEATLRVFAAAVPTANADVRRLVATAVRLGLRAAPATPFAAMAPPDAEAVACDPLLAPRRGPRRRASSASTAECGAGSCAA